MLVLSRRAGQTLLIGKDIVLTVNRVAGNRVTVSIEAPKSLHIVRGELRDKPAEPGERAA